MSTMTTTRSAEQVLATLRAHEAELRGAGIRSVSLFGSVARGDAGPDSDVDLLAELDPAAHIGLIELSALERRLADLLCCPVDLTAGPVQKPRLRINIARDGQLAF